jgi:DNA sulfur modification protein DndB
MSQGAWKNLERQMLRLVSKHLQADDFGGGPKCSIGGYQIDAYGVFAKTALIFECKTGKRVNLKQAVDRLSAARSIIRREIRHQHGKHIRYFRFVIVVGRTEDIAKHRRRMPKDIVVWTPKYFDSVKSLAKAINRRALPYILKELHFKDLREAMAMPRAKIRLPALRVKLRSNQRNESIYSFFAPARTLLDLGYVARLESNLPSAYQRLLNGSRLKALEDYINVGNSFKNSVVVNLPDNVRFARKSSATLTPSTQKVDLGVLKIPVVPASLWIIDGQHRIYGYNSTHKLDSPLSVIGVQFMTTFEQGKIFVDINKNQKPVDPNLLWDLYFHLAPNDYTGVISALVRDLSCNRQSKLYEKIYVPEVSQKARKDYKIYMANVCEAVVKQNLLQSALRYSSKTRLEDMRIKRLREASALVYRQLNRLYRALHDLCSQLGQTAWWRRFFLSNNGISIMLRILKEFFTYKKAPSTQKAFRIFLKDPLANYFSLMTGRLDDILKNTSSEGGRESVAIDLLIQANNVHENFAVDKLREARKTARQDLFFITIGFFEKNMRQIIEEQLSKLAADWWGQRIPPSVKQAAEAKWEQKDKIGEPLNFLDLSDYPRILSHNWSDAFSVHYGKIKKDRNWLNLKFQELITLRNKYFHFHGSVTPSEQDTWHIRILIDDILRPFGIETASIKANAA